MKYWDVFRNPKWLLDNLLSKYKVLIVPVNAGWSTSNVGSGGVSYNPLILTASTGTTASSRGMVYIAARHLNSGDLGTDYVDWTKRLELHLILYRVNSDSEAVARIQLKESSSEGALAQRGIGVEIDNYTMYGEGYGTARGTVGIGTLSDYRLVRVKIVKVGAELQFWVNNVLQGRLTGVNVPNVQGTTGACIVVSIVNGTTGGVNAILSVGDIKIIQEW
jgi:hypothetical protein